MAAPGSNLKESQVLGGGLALSIAAGAEFLSGIIPLTPAMWLLILALCAAVLTATVEYKPPRKGIAVYRVRTVVMTIFAGLSLAVAAAGIDQLYWAGPPPLVRSVVAQVWPQPTPPECVGTKCSTSEEEKERP